MYERTLIMSNLMSKFNHGNNVFGIDVSGYNFIKLSEAYQDEKMFPEHMLSVYGLFINKKGKFQPHPVAIVDTDHKVAVDLPSHLTDDVQNMLDSDEIVNYIKDGHCGIKIEPYFSSTWKKNFYGVQWLDI